MSTVTLKMPRLGETMEDGTVADWLVEEGAEFSRGAPLVEFETDKTAVEFPALGPGRLVRVLAGKGAQVKLGEPLAEIDLMGAENWVAEATPETADTEAMEESGGVERAAWENGTEPETVEIDLPMPRLGETMEEGRIVAWLVSPGATFTRGAPLLEVETDKTVAEFPALFPGTLLKTLAEPGEMIAVDTPIARVAVAPEHAPDQPAAVEEPAAVTVAPEAPASGATQPAAAPKATPNAGRRSRATPLARRAARRAGLLVDAIRGTGRRGRVELADVERAIGGTAAGALAFTDYGPSGPRDMLLVHGFAGDRLTFDQLGRALARAGVAARALDLPGHGETEAPATQLGDLVEGLAATLDPARPVHLVGHSLGAAVCVLAAAQAGGVSHLTLIAPAGLGLFIDAEFVEGMAQARSEGAVGHLLRRVSHRADSFSAEMIAQVHAQLSTGRLRVLADEICRGGQQTVNIRAPLAELAGRIPVRILLGQGDQIIDWRDALDVSSAIALHVFARAGHMPHWDAPAEVAELICNGSDS